MDDSSFCQQKPYPEEALEIFEGVSQDAIRT